MQAIPNINNTISGFQVLGLPYLTFVDPVISRGVSWYPPSDELAINQEIFRATAPKYSQLPIRRLIWPNTFSHRQLLARAIEPNFLA